MNNVAEAVEHDDIYRQVIEAQRTAARSGVSDAITVAAREVAETTQVKAICCFSHSGTTALLAARERPRVPIIALTPLVGTARRLALSWGLHCVVVPEVDRFKMAVVSAARVAREHGFAERGRPDRRHRRHPVRRRRLDQHPARRHRQRARDLRGRRRGLTPVLRRRPGHWARIAADWIAWARTPGHDAFWHYRAALADLIGPGGGALRSTSAAARAGSRGSWASSATASPPATRWRRWSRRRARRTRPTPTPSRRPRRCRSPTPPSIWSLAYNVLMDIDDIDAAAAELRRVIRDDGRLVVSVVHPLQRPRRAPRAAGSSSRADWFATVALRGPRRAGRARDGLRRLGAADRVLRRSPRRGGLRGHRPRRAAPRPGRSAASRRRRHPADLPLAGRRTASTLTGRAAVRGLPPTALAISGRHRTLLFETETKGEQAT